MAAFSLTDLERIIAERARSGDPDSWTAKLFAGGIDKAAQKGVIHANAAARGKSRLLKKYNLATASAVAAAASTSTAESEKEAPKRRPAARKTDAKPTAKKAAPKSASAEKPARSRTRKTS